MISSSRALQGRRGKAPDSGIPPGKGIEALSVRILPRTAPINVMGLHPLFRQLLRQLCRDRLRAVVTSQMLRRPSVAEDLFQPLGDVLRPTTTIRPSRVLATLGAHARTRASSARLRPTCSLRRTLFVLYFVGNRGTTAVGGLRGTKPTDRGGRSGACSRGGSSLGTAPGTPSRVACLTEGLVCLVAFPLRVVLNVGAGWFSGSRTFVLPIILGAAAAALVASPVTRTVFAR